ncbi:MAG TPA: type IV secretion system DNA-binding domain-containing protein, partial [Terriglobia bacterium]|nr:type IV secretion system DNA-binding domain-containing protein [Terriglobia bacterium]
ATADPDDLVDFRILLLDIPTATGRAPSFFATDRDVSPLGDGRFKTTEEAHRRGATAVRWMTYPRVNAAELYWQLRDHIYAGKSPGDSFQTPRYASYLVFVCIIAVGLYFDRADIIRRRQGEHVRGPQILTVAEFNKKRQGEGIGIIAGGSRKEIIRLRQQDECLHFLIMGDTGTGKSVIIAQFLDQLRERGDAVIVYDPAREFIIRHYEREHGDVLLNPLDRRSPYWDPSNELTHPSEALTIAKSLFPDKEMENRFFTESSRKIFAYLLTFRPSAKDLIEWMSNPDEIDARLTGTALAPLIDKTAAPQRSAVLSTLNLVSDALKLLPSRDETTAEWSAVSWARERKGWIFISSTPETRESLLPLISMWLDMLILRLMSANQKWTHDRPVWVVADEVASLQKLPQLATALTESRKPNVRILLGFQGRSQLESRYGLEAEVMLSQPSTKIFLRTSEPRAAKWISDSIGEVTVERMREGVTAAVHDWRDSANYTMNRETEPLISPAQITGLPSLTGYIKSENHIVKFQFRPDPRTEREAGFLARPAKPVAATQQPIVSNDTRPAQSPVRTNDKQRSTSREIAPAKSVDLKIWE